MFNRSDVKDMYSLSPMQEGMLFYYILNKGSTVFIEQMNFRIEGKLDQGLFEQAFNKLVEKYDVLRTIFVYKNTPKPRQVVLKKRNASIHFQDLSHLEGEEKEREVNTFRKEDREKNYDLSKDIPMRFSLLKLAEEEYEIVWSFHHIIMDGWCMAILLKEILYIYSLLKKGKPVQLPFVPPYSDYIRWLEKQDKDTGTRYWQTYLADYENPAVMPAAQEGKVYQYVQGEREFKIHRSFTAELKQRANENKVTLNILFQAAWGLLLQKYNNTDDVVFAAVVSGRPSELPGVESIIGLFMNTLPVRVKTQPGQTFRELMVKLKESVALVNKYDYVPLVDIQANSKLKRELLNHVVIFENYPLDQEFLNLKVKEDLGLSLKDLNSFSHANYDMDITIIPWDEITVRIKYNTRVYDPLMVAAVEGHLRNIFTRVAADPGTPVDEIDILTEAEKQRLVKDFNSNRTGYPGDKTIVQLFRQQAEIQPEKTALMFKETQWTYNELDEKANQLAKVLMKTGIGKDKTVGILMHRSPLMVQSILAIWQAGGAYIPLDPKYPVQRLIEILTNSETAVLVTGSPFITTQLEKEFKGTIVTLDTWDQQIGKENPSSPDLEIDIASLAYVIYTSGSTGKPKGAMVEHRGMMNHMWAKINDLQLTHECIVAQNASHCFDISVWQFFASLVIGGTTVIYPNELTLDPGKFIDKVIEDNVTILEVVPSYLLALLDTLELSPRELTTLNYVLVTGETVKPTLVKQWFEKYPGIKMVNAYGPTEASDDITHYIMAEALQLERIPIGMPLQNLNIYITDRNMKLCPLGVKGEICVSGVGVGRGYLNDEAKTREVFTNDPFVEEEGVRMYKTGDLGRWSRQGYIEFFGRIDNQVKIRGFRIELGEIETQLMKNEAIKEAVVTVKTDDRKEKYLCAYYVSEKDLTTAEIRAELSRELPDYMLPAYFVKLPHLPLTPNGKIDRKALPDPEGDINTGVDYSPPENEIQEILANAWQQVLGISKPGIDDNYFSLGGDSIKAIQVASRLYNQGLKLEIQDLMQYPTIRQLNSFIVPLTQTISQEVVEGEVLLTPIQKWFFESNYTDMHHINQAVMLLAKEKFDRGILQQVFTHLVRHHDALRMVFKRENGMVKQINRAITDNMVDLSFFDLKEEQEYQRVIENECNRIQGSMDLSNGPLIKVALFKAEKGDYLLIAAHHLVIDGVSWRILLEDFTTAYNQVEKGEEIRLPLKSTSFKEWANALVNYSNSQKLLQELPYWKQLTETSISPLPKDRTTADQRVQNTRELSLELSREYTEKLLKEVNQAYNTEINDILLSALGLALQQWAGQEKIWLDVEGHGREDISDDIDVTRTVGWFTSLYPLLLDISGIDDLPTMIKNTKEMLRHLPNKGIGYGILKYLTPAQMKPDCRFDLQPEIKFNYLGQFDEDLDTNRFGLADISPGNPISLNSQREYLLDIYGIINQKRLKLSVSYNTREYDEERILGLINSYEERLVQIIDHCTGKEDTELTVSDFSTTQMDTEDMENMFEVLEENLFEENIN